MENDETRHCFRCKGLAVINKRSLEKLPDVLRHSAELLIFAMYEAGDQETVANLIDSLREYAIMIEGMPNGD